MDEYPLDARASRRRHYDLDPRTRHMQPPQSGGAQVAERGPGTGGQKRRRLIAQLDAGGVSEDKNTARKGTQHATADKAGHSILADASGVELSARYATALAISDGRDALVTRPRNALDCTPTEHLHDESASWRDFRAFPHT
jgi:hypothetical protein